MKIPNPFLLLVAGLAAFGAITPQRAHAQVSVSFFYDSLDPYGEWVQVPDYGYCWHPTSVDENWAPYTDGYWAYTDEGWTWVSYEDYGSVVYHYGRWARIPGEGWVWVPGETWAPAWVSWRTSDDYVGWAPLPPEAHWRAGIGFTPWADVSFDIGPGFYSFVSAGDFGSPTLSGVILDRSRNVTIINNTTNVTNITYNNSTVYNGGPSYSKLAAHSSRPIPTLKLSRQTSVPGEGGKMLAHQQGNQLVVYAPKVSAPAGGKLPPPPKVARTLTGVKADHGWAGVSDPGERTKLQAQYKQQARSYGEQGAPAKSVNPEDVKLVGERIKAKGATKPETGTELATGENTPRAKTSKHKKESLSELENAPATGAPGTAEATPKSRKGRKSHTAEQSAFEGTGAGSDETPMPKKHKKSKASSEEQGGSYGGKSTESETPKKHSKSSDSGLEPFTSGESTSEKPKKHSEYSPESRPASSYSGAEEPKAPKGKKKKKESDQNYQPGQ